MKMKKKELENSQLKSEKKYIKKIQKKKHLKIWIVK